jgi:hypothetical protein
LFRLETEPRGFRGTCTSLPVLGPTLSVRIKKAEAAEANARDRAPIGEQEVPAAGRAEYIRQLQRIALGHDPTAGARDRLSAIKELLKLEPAASEQAPVGAVYHVYPSDRTIEAEGEVVARGDEGEDVSEPQNAGAGRR